MGSFTPASLPMYSPLDQFAGAEVFEFSLLVALLVAQLQCAGTYVKRYNRLGRPVAQPG